MYGYVWSQFELFSFPPKYIVAFIQQKSISPCQTDHVQRLLLCEGVEHVYSKDLQVVLQTRYFVLGLVQAQFSEEQLIPAG